MHRKLVEFFKRESVLMNTTEEIPGSQTIEKTEALSDLYSTYASPIKCLHQTNSRKMYQNKNLVSVLRQREVGLLNLGRCPSARHRLMDRLLPNDCEVVATMTRPIFCGQFSEDGQSFLSACQDCYIRLFDTTSRTFCQKTEKAADEVGWSILDTALSPNGTTAAYSTWSDCIYLINISGEDQRHSNTIPLFLQPQSHSFSIFSLQYSADGTEIIGGSNDTCVYVYDLQKHRRTLRVQAHDDDVNAVRFVDNSNSLIVSGADDSLVSIWDRRALKESNPKPVGVFAGHSNGVTFVHSRTDTRYLISNSKDQSIKLWDMRRFANESTIEKGRQISTDASSGWDYRYDDAYEPRPKRHNIRGDPSVRTYCGHSVSYTLIRCYFSPAFTTGQKYIITGSSDGCIRIYDVLTGEMKVGLRVSQSSRGHGSRELCVRDVAWHPYENYIISSSWDSRRAHVRWMYSAEKLNDSSAQPSSEPSIVSLETNDSPPTQRPQTLRRLLFQQLLGDYHDMDSDDDYSP